MAIPLVLQLDFLTAKRIKDRAGNKCENPICQSRQQLCWSHIISRSVKHMRWDEENALCLCWGCEWYYTNHPAEFKVFIDSLRGEGFYEMLERRSHEIPASC